MGGRATTDRLNSIARPAQPGPVERFVALMYHNIARGRRSYGDLSPSDTSYFVNRSTFARQMKAISSTGIHCLSWNELAAFYAHQSQPPASASQQNPSLLLTFDDGWKGTVEFGGPVLQEHGFQAMLFVTTDFLGRPHALSKEELSKLDRRVFHVGSHARTHRMLSLLSEAEIRSELVDSKRLLEDLVGYEVDSISIPGGAVDARVRQIAGESGYRLVFDSEVRVNRRQDSPQAIGRIAILHHTQMQAFERIVRGDLHCRRLWRAALGYPKRVLGLRRYVWLRQRLLGHKPDHKLAHQT